MGTVTSWLRPYRTSRVGVNRALDSQNEYAKKGKIEPPQEWPSQRAPATAIARARERVIDSIERPSGKSGERPVAAGKTPSGVCVTPPAMQPGTMSVPRDLAAFEWRDSEGFACDDGGV